MTHPTAAAAAPQSTRFTDNQGRTWSLDVGIVDVKAIRSQLGVDLMDLLNGRADALKKLIDNPETLVDALWLICREQAQRMTVVDPETGEKRQGVTDEEFGRGLYGDAIDQAVDALMVGLAHFFPKHQRPVVLGVVQRIQAAHSQISERALAAMQSDRMDAAILQQADAAIEQMFRQIETRPPTETLNTGGASSPS